MLKSIAISLWMAAQALAEPIPIDLPELRDIVGREIEPRILRNVSVVATFEDRVAQNGPTRTALGVYKGLNFQGLGK